jgi:sucrose-6-phosphate hydrolase SacC (GH32 family)
LLSLDDKGALCQKPLTELEYLRGQYFNMSKQSITSEQVAMTNLVFPKPDSTGISLTANGGRLENVQLKMWRLHSAWKERPE